LAQGRAGERLGEELGAPSSQFQSCIRPNYRKDALDDLRIEGGISKDEVPCSVELGHLLHETVDRECHRGSRVMAVAEGEE
jgi:hypothetical protein